jgi:hypothetical protein
VLINLTELEDIICRQEIQWSIRKELGNWRTGNTVHGKEMDIIVVLFIEM